MENSLFIDIAITILALEIVLAIVTFVIFGAILVYEYLSHTPIPRFRYRTHLRNLYLSILGMFTIFLAYFSLFASESLTGSHIVVLHGVILLFATVQPYWQPLRNS